MPATSSMATAISSSSVIRTATSPPYAHAKELLVKRGDQVKRGQPIARSGQTGNANAPQLHFEIRKGASPLDPINFLNGV